MKFNKIVCVDKTKLKDWAIEELQGYCENNLENYTDYPEDTEEVIHRIGDAEAVFVSWHTPLGEDVISRCPNLKYIGMCCSLYDDESANVAVNYARNKGITVIGIRDYGDPGVVEFIISKLVALLHGFDEHQWKEKPLELTERKIGIIGLGVTGQLLAQCLLPFGANLFYYSRSRKSEWEEKGVEYLPLHRLAETVDIISFHLPKNTKIFNEEEFKAFGNGKILINTSLGLPFSEEPFGQWIQEPGNFAIFDGDGKNDLGKSLKQAQNIISVTKSAGWSAQTHERLSQKVLENVREFIKAQ